MQRQSRCCQHDWPFFPAECFRGCASTLNKGALRMSPQIDQPRLVSIKTVAAMTSLSRTMINALRSDGVFPVAVELGPRRIGFVRDEVEVWIDSRIAARQAA
jgi:prophage regulatory protein